MNIKQKPAPSKRCFSKLSPGNTGKKLCSPEIETGRFLILTANLEYLFLEYALYMYIEFSTTPVNDYKAQIGYM